MRFIFILAISYYFKKRINCDIINLDKGVEPWQSGNAADSKSAEGANPPWVRIPPFPPEPTKEAWQSGLMQRS